MRLRVRGFGVRLYLHWCHAQLGSGPRIIRSFPGQKSWDVLYRPIHFGVQWGKFV